MLGALVRYFDLFYTPHVLTAGTPRPTSGVMGIIRELLVYLGLIIGVMVEPLIPTINDPSMKDISAAFAWPRALGAAIIALAIFPQVYKSALDRDQPVLAQAGVVLMAGIGWRSTFEGLTHGMHFGA